MEELFGLSMTTLMYILLAVVLGSMTVLSVLAFRNRIMLKMGLRPIPRRPAQTALIILGVMLSTVIMAAAFGTGDTLSFSIRNEAVNGLQHIDELIVPSRAGDDASFGVTYLPMERFDEMVSELSSNDNIDGIMPQIAERVAVQNARTKLSEGQMNLVGLDPTVLHRFGGLALAEGGLVQPGDLAADQVYVSEEGAEELEATIGDEVNVFLEDGIETLEIKGVLRRGGFAGIEPTLVVSLERAQELLDRPGQLNSIVISNRGDERSGGELSEEVTEDLRAIFNDREVAGRLKDLFSQGPVISTVEKKLGEEGLDEELGARLSEFLVELQKPELTDRLNSLLADDEVTQAVVELIEDEGMEDVAVQAFTLFLDLAELRVIEVKRNLLEGADEAGSAVTSIFILFSSFSIAVGILLIFLIFVMLAAARKSEMGMARAVGAKRRHLMMMFAFEGTAYAVASSAIGVVLGLGVSALMVTVLNQIFSGLEEDFILSIHFEPRSVVVAYCLGMAITFLTVAVSAYRVSRLNIVVAIRDLPENLLPRTEPPFGVRLRGMLKSFVLPGHYLYGAFRALLRHHLGGFARNLGLAVAVVFPVWQIAIVIGILRFIQPYLLRGWLLAIVGIFLTYLAVVQWERASWFGAGVSLTILGLGLMLRWGLGRTDLRPETVDRASFTITGVLVLVFWALPSSLLEPLVGDLEGDFDIMFVSGIAMVGAAVWTVMYNADLLTQVLSTLTSRLGRLRPVLVTAVAYPLSSKFRTGLTLAMFALVVFTLTIMSVLTGTFTTQFEEPRKIYMGFDIGASVNLNAPVDDIRAFINSDPDLEGTQIRAIGGITTVPVDLRQQEGERGRWYSRTGMLVDQGFFDAADLDMKLIAEGYGPTPRDVLESMKADPTLAIAGGWLLPNEGDLAREGDEPRLFGALHYGSTVMEPVSLDVRESRTGIQRSVTVIGVFDRFHANAFRILGSKALVDEALPFPIPLTNYRFRLADGADAKDTSKALELAFLENGMQTEVFSETVEEENAAGEAFFRLFTGFMALGLFVGVAALGVISTRAVVERRQQIGVLRAIGYKRGMITLSFLLESSFVSLFGTAIGLVLGLVLSYQAVNDIRAETGLSGITFTVPWFQIGLILALTYGFSLLATFLPARQASRIYPAEALRYE